MERKVPCDRSNEVAKTVGAGSQPVAGDTIPMCCGSPQLQITDQTAHPLPMFLLSWTLKPLLIQYPSASFSAVRPSPLCPSGGCHAIATGSS